MRALDPLRWIRQATAIALVLPLAGCLTSTFLQEPLPPESGPGGTVRVSVFDHEAGARAGQLTARSVATELYRSDEWGERLVHTSWEPQWRCDDLEPGTYRLHTANFIGEKDGAPGYRTRDEVFRVSASRLVQADIVLHDGAEGAIQALDIFSLVLAATLSDEITVDLSRMTVTAEVRP